MSRSILFATDVAIRHPSREWSRRFTEDLGPDKHQGWTIDIQAPDKVQLRRDGVTVTVSGIGYSLVEEEPAAGSVLAVMDEQMAEAHQRGQEVIERLDERAAQAMLEMADELKAAEAKQTTEPEGVDMAAPLPADLKPSGAVLVRPDGEVLSLKVKLDEPEQRPAPKKRGRRRKHR